MKTSLLPLGILFVAVVGPGCSLVVDGTLSSRDAGAGLDSPTTACGVAADGERCSIEGLLSNRICIAGACVAASCGDGFVETRMLDGMPQEICDDGNETSGDGCDTDCTFSCSEAADCDDMETCNGVESCNTTTHACAPGTQEMDGTACTVESVMAMCRDGACRSGVCPNGMTEPGEECDDNNAVDEDGCDADCTFSCSADTDCQDADACDGSELCDPVLHTCAEGAVTVCDDEDVCTTDSCEPATGCVFASVFVDGDMDGFTVAMAGAPPACVSEDCDDANASAYPGAPETCGTVDLNCDGSTAAPVYYADCDDDGFAASGAASMMSCTPPATRPSGCATGSVGAWTTRAPGSSTTDCADNDDRAYPGTRSFYATPVAVRGGYDFNCDGRTTTQYPVGRPTFYMECSGLSCTGTTWIEGLGRTVNCGRQSSPYPQLSHCVSGILPLCSRQEDNMANVLCQ